MSRIRKRPAWIGAAGLLVAASAFMLLAFGGASAGAKGVKVLKSLTTTTASVPGITQTNDDQGYASLIPTATCPSGQTAVGANAYWSISNTGLGTLDGDELLLAAVKKVGNGYSAEGLSDYNAATVPHTFFLEVRCAKTVKVDKPD